MATGAGIIDRGICVALDLMSLLITIITPIVYRNWVFMDKTCRYDPAGKEMAS